MPIDRQRVKVLAAERQGALRPAPSAREAVRNLLDAHSRQFAEAAEAVADTRLRARAIATGEREVAEPSAEAISLRTWLEEYRDGYALCLGQASHLGRVIEAEARFEEGRRRTRPGREVSAEQRELDERLRRAREVVSAFVDVFEATERWFGGDGPEPVDLMQCLAFWTNEILGE